MRHLSALATFLAAVLAGFGAMSLTLAVTSEMGEPGRRATAVTASEVRRPETSEEATGAWPPLFGRVREVPDAEPEADEPEPTGPRSDRYTLQGFVAGRDTSWAIISDGQEAVLVRKGDTLPDGERVARIDERGAWIATSDGTTEVIGFDAGSGDVRSALTDTGAEGSDDPARSATREHRAELPLSDVRGGNLRSALARGGGVQTVELRDGLKAQEILWVRSGRLYDRIGLRKGDVVATVNGVPAGDTEAIRAAAADLLGAREIRLGIVRDGASQLIRVVLTDDD